AGGERRRYTGLIGRRHNGRAASSRHRWWLLFTPPAAIVAVTVRVRSVRGGRRCPDHERRNRREHEQGALEAAGHTLHGAPPCMSAITAGTHRHDRPNRIAGSEPRAGVALL